MNNSQMTNTVLKLLHIFVKRLKNNMCNLSFMFSMFIKCWTIQISRPWNSPKKKSRFQKLSQLNGFKWRNNWNAVDINPETCFFIYMPLLTVCLSVCLSTLTISLNCSIKLHLWSTATLCKNNSYLNLQAPWLWIVLEDVQLKTTLSICVR